MERINPQSPLPPVPLECDVDLERQKLEFEMRKFESKKMKKADLKL